MEVRQVVRLTPDTLEQLCDLLIAVVQEGASVGFLPPLSRAEARDYWSKVLQPGVLLWVAEENGLVQGTVQLHLVWKPNGTHRAEVAKLQVHPRAQRRGIGRRLMETLENEARRQQRTLLVLDTRAGDPSNRLYLSLGFVEAGRIPYFARNPEGGLDTTVLYYKLLEA